MGKKGTFIVPIGCCERCRVPKVSLFVPFGLDLLYAAVGIFLAVLAFSLRPRLTKNVQGRLSVAGLAAACFESRERVEQPVETLQGLFSESQPRYRGEKCKKIGIVEPKQGGWKYETI
jgi:hypothetical protein